jgi:hypothetical protein
MAALTLIQDGEARAFDIQLARGVEQRRDEKVSNNPSAHLVANAEIAR